MILVRLKEGVKEAVYYGKCIYPNKNYTAIEDKYLDVLLQDDRIEIYQEPQQEQEQKAELKNETKDKVNLEEVNNFKNTDGKEKNDDLITALLSMHWMKAAKQIETIQDIDFLQNKLLPVLTESNKTKLIEITNTQIEKLNG